MAITGGEPVAYWPLGDNSNPNAPGSFPNLSVGADSVFDFIPNDYINLGEDVVPATPAWTSLTVSGWVKKDATGSYGRLIGKDDGGSNRVFLLQVQSNDKLSGSIRTTSGSSWNNVQTTTNVAIGEWQHVAMTYTANGLIRLYINGEVKASSSNTIANLNPRTTNTLIGAKGSGQPSSTPTNVFDGQISNVQIWDVEISPTEMLEVYNNGQPLMTGTQPQEANLKAWYKLNQSANWEADTAGEWQIPDAVSAYPQSFNFDGSGEHIDVSSFDNAILSDGDISFSLWCKLTSTGTYQYILSSEHTSTISGINIAMHPNTNLSFSRAQDIANTQNGTGYVVPGFSYGSWHHLCGTYNATSGELKAYVDGDLKSTQL